MDRHLGLELGVGLRLVEGMVRFRVKSLNYKLRTSWWNSAEFPCFSSIHVAISNTVFTFHYFLNQLL